MKRSCLKGCFCSKAAFTLIELLVVVLIIGILAAVAVPQYQKAVRKARIAEAKVSLKALVDASDVYVLEHGTGEGLDWMTVNSLLDVEVPTQSKNWEFEFDECAAGSQGIVGCVFWAIPRFEEGYRITYYSRNYDSILAGQFACRPECSGNLCEAGKKICQELGQAEVTEEELYKM